MSEADLGRLNPGSHAASAVEGHASTLGSEVTAGLLGVGVAVACVLPPLVHLVTGPLGPFIGGFVGANRAKPGARGRLIIALMIGTGLSGIIGTATEIFARLVGQSELPEWFPSNGTLFALLGAVWVYGAALGGIGTLVSGSLAGRAPKGGGATDRRTDAGE